MHEIKNEAFVDGENRSDKELWGNGISCRVVSSRTGQPQEQVIQIYESEAVGVSGARHAWLKRRLPLF